MTGALLTALLGASLMLGSTDLAYAQPYPDRPIRMIVPFPAGGPTDGMAGMISDPLSGVLGQTGVVENHGGGAGGSVGAKAAATAVPDGYTDLLPPAGA